MTDYQQKYLIYKKKYLMLQEQLAGYYNDITVTDLVNKINLTSSDSTMYQNLVNLLKVSKINKDVNKTYSFSFNDKQSATNLAETLYSYKIYHMKQVNESNGRFFVSLQLENMIVLVKILLKNKARYSEENVNDNGVRTSKFNISANVDSPRRIVGNSYISRSPYISPSIISIPNLPVVYSDSSSDMYPLNAYGLPAVPYGLPIAVSPRRHHRHHKRH